MYKIIVQKDSLTDCKYSETSLMRRPLELENKVELGGCRIRAVILY